MLFLGASHSYAETPGPDVVLVPGSGPRTVTAMADTQLLDWLRQVHETTEWTTSVCTEAMIWPPPASSTDCRRPPTGWRSLAGRHGRQGPARAADRPRRQDYRGRRVGIDLGLWLAGEIAGRERAEAIQLYIEYDPQPPFDTGSPSKASKTVLDDARTLGRRIAVNPSELRAVPTVAWRRALNGSCARATKGVHR